MKIKKNLLIGFFVISAIIFLGYFIILNEKAIKGFYKSEYRGIIKDKKKCEKGYLWIKLKNDDWHYLGMFYNANIYIIQLNDSISKQKDSYTIEIFKKDSLVYKRRYK